MQAGRLRAIAIEALVFFLLGIAVLLLYRTINPLAYPGLESRLFESAVMLGVLAVAAFAWEKLSATKIDVALPDFSLSDLVPAAAGAVCGGYLYATLPMDWPFSAIAFLAAFLAVFVASSSIEASR